MSSWTLPLHSSWAFSPPEDTLPDTHPDVTSSYQMGARMAQGSSEPLLLMAPGNHITRVRQSSTLVTHFWVSGTETGLSQPAYLGWEEHV